MKVAFIGAGNMGEAILAAILNSRLSKAEEIWVSDKIEARRQQLEQKYHIKASDANRVAASHGEVVILAVKPQNLTEVMADLKGSLKPDQLVLSIIAGARIDTMRLGMAHHCIVRAMPNTPAQISQGITVWTATPEVSPAQKKQASSILAVMGKEFYVDDEKYLDMATAVSGSGPAYFFLFIEALIEAATEIGLPFDMAKELVVGTMLGSGNYLLKSGKTPAELRKMVTSPGGTTAEALKQFEQGNFSGIVKQAILAAYRRANELGR